MDYLKENVQAEDTFGINAVTPRNFQKTIQHSRRSSRFNEHLQRIPLEPKENKNRTPWMAEKRHNFAPGKICNNRTAVSSCGYYTNGARSSQAVRYKPENNPFCFPATEENIDELLERELRCKQSGKVNPNSREQKELKSQFQQLVEENAKIQNDIMTLFTNERQIRSPEYENYSKAKAGSDIKGVLSARATIQTKEKTVEKV